MYQFVNLTMQLPSSLTTDFIDADQAAEILTSNSATRERVGGMTLHRVGAGDDECLVIEGGCGAVLLVRPSQATSLH